jgi:hypothetical protein
MRVEEPTAFEPMSLLLAIVICHYRVSSHFCSRAKVRVLNNKSLLLQGFKRVSSSLPLFLSLRLQPWLVPHHMREVLLLLVSETSKHHSWSPDRQGIRNFHLVVAACEFLEDRLWFVYIFWARLSSFASDYWAQQLVSLVA